MFLLLSQVKEFGCTSFSLLFDDIETEMCPADKQAFSSFAHAQVAVANEVFQHLGEPEIFLFCPTGESAFRASTNVYKLSHAISMVFCFVFSDYCAAFCTPSVSQSSYLHTVGEKLLPGIDILWTGKNAHSRLSHISINTQGRFSGLVLFLHYLGPKVVSHKISVESIDEVSTVLKRAPVIWDNIHANDYDPQRLFLGPYKVHRSSSDTIISNLTM